MISPNFLRNYLKFMAFMMAMITIGIFTTFANFSGETSDAYARVLFLTEKHEELLAQRDYHYASNVEFVPDVNLVLSKTLPLKYVVAGSENITIAHLLVKNDAETSIVLRDLSLGLEQNDAEAFNFKLFYEGSDITKSASIEDGKIVFRDIKNSISAGEELDIAIKADIGSSLAGSKIQLSIDTQEDLFIYENGDRLLVKPNHVLAPTVTIIGR